MNKFTSLFRKYSGKINKYYLTFAIFLVLTFFVGESNLYKRYQYDQKIKFLKSQIQEYQHNIEDSKAKLDALRTDNENLERYAREQFLMSKPDEEIFIIK